MIGGPSTRDVLSRWYNGQDTYDIAKALGCEESDVYNVLVRLDGPNIADHSQSPEMQRHGGDRLRSFIGSVPSVDASSLSAKNHGRQSRCETRKSQSVTTRGTL